MKKCYNDGSKSHFMKYSDRIIIFILGETELIKIYFIIIIINCD